MKKIIASLLMLFVATWSSGTVNLTSEEKQDLDVSRRKWHRDVEDRYNTKALQKFLLRSIQETKEIGGVVLNEIPAGRKFIYRGNFFCMVSGRWLFVSANPQGDSFELRAISGEQGWGILACKRHGTKTFTVEKTWIDPVVQVSPQPYLLTP